MNNPCDTCSPFPSCDKGCEKLNKFQEWRRKEKKDFNSKCEACALKHSIIENQKLKLEEYAKEISELKETNYNLETINREYRGLLFGN